MLRQRINAIGTTRRRYGYQRIYLLLRREGWLANHKKVHRIYKEEGQNLRNKRPRRVAANAPASVQSISAGVWAL